MSREALLRRIAAEGRVTFRDAMDAALNDPDDGWYGSGKASIGVDGDFTTSAELHPLFGSCVASWVARAWDRLDQPDEFTIVEFGAGKGSLARAMLDALRMERPPLYDVARSVLVESSAAMRAHAATKLDEHSEHVEIVAALAPEALETTTVVVSNEFVDALPVHVARVSDSGEVEELYVTAGAVGGFAGAFARPSTGRIAEYAGKFVPQIRSARPFVFEVGLDAVDWMNGITSAPGVRAALTVDYGDIAERIAGPQRPEGTLRAMRGRLPVKDVVGSLFEADLTADVHFDVLAAIAITNGWVTRELVTQATWLCRMGAIERIASAASASIAERLAMKTLLAPGGLGDRLKVLEMERVRPSEPRFARNPERSDGPTIE